MIEALIINLEYKLEHSLVNRIVNILPTFHFTSQMFQDQSHDYIFLNTIEFYLHTIFYVA